MPYLSVNLSSVWSQEPSQPVKRFEHGSLSYSGGNVDSGSRKFHTKTMFRLTLALHKTMKHHSFISMRPLR